MELQWPDKIKGLRQTWTQKEKKEKKNWSLHIDTNKHMWENWIME